MIMLLITLQTITLVLAGLMVGNELAVAAFIHPQIRVLDDKVHTASAQAFARIYGTVMPFWYALVLGLTTVTTFIIDRSQLLSFRFAVASAILWSIAILLTIARLVPINRQVSNWHLNNLPGNWKDLRNHWDNLHTLRVAILIVALVCLTIACLLWR